MEEIIIDGIDISECEYINCCSKKAKCIILQDDILSDSQYCESESNCYYKQLKRLEQENTKLKEELQRYKDMEAKGLEEFKDVGGCWGCGIQSASDQYFNEAKKYRKALEEIREVVKRTDFCHSPSVANLISVIRHEINEVLGND